MYRIFSFYLIFLVACPAPDGLPPDGLPTDGLPTASCGPNSPACHGRPYLIFDCDTSYNTQTTNNGFACSCTRYLHSGACLVGEGMACGMVDGGASCGGGMYCSPTVSRCTKIGACQDSRDCPAAFGPTDGGSGCTVCVGGTCCP